MNIFCLLFCFIILSNVSTNYCMDDAALKKVAMTTIALATFVGSGFIGKNFSAQVGQHCIHDELFEFSDVIKVACSFGLLGLCTAIMAHYYVVPHCVLPDEQPVGRTATVLGGTALEVIFGGMIGLYLMTLPVCGGN